MKNSKRVVSLTEMLTNNCWISSHYVLHNIIVCSVFFFCSFLESLFARHCFRFSFYRFPWNIYSVSMVWHFNTCTFNTILLSTFLLRLCGIPKRFYLKLEWYEMKCFSFRVFSPDVCISYDTMMIMQQILLQNFGWNSCHRFLFYSIDSK